MKKMKNTKAKYLASGLAVATAAFLAACGGGGSTAPVTGVALNYSATCTGGTTVTSTISQADAQGKCPNVGSAGLVVTVPIPTYAAASEEKAAFDLLNAERGKCGFGLLAQSTQLDAAAKGHADYQVINFTLGHFQNQAQFPLGFTGTSPADRVTAAGYVNWGLVGDEIAAVPSNNTVGFGLSGMRGLLVGPYHLAGLMRGYRDVGLAVRSNLQTSPVGQTAYSVLQVNLAYSTASGSQLQATTDTLTYPCDGTTGVNRQLLGESINPVPGRNLATDPIGTPIYTMARLGNTVTIASASMRETLTNTAVVLRTPITGANDPNTYYGPHEGYVAPDAPLKALTNYTVTMSGSNNGSAFTKTFSFTTGN